MDRGRKISGGKYHQFRKRRRHTILVQTRHAVIGETKTKKLRGRGGNIKVILLKSNEANVVVEGKTKVAQIKNVSETPQNRFFARENRLVKGAIIETSLGKAKITNRPSQEGQVNAILLAK